MYAISRSASICQGQTFIRPGGGVVTQPGAYKDTLNTVYGCDSIVTTNLTVNPVYAISRSASICQGQTFIRPGGGVATQAGVYYDSLTTIKGCDSVITTTLTVNPTYAILLNPSICQGDSLLLPDASYAYQTGTYSVALSSINTCDSVITTELTVNPTYTVEVFDTICLGASVLLPDSQLAYNSGVYPITLQTTQGCDSLIITNVQANPVYYLTQNKSICQGQSFILPNGQPVTAPGSYPVTLATVDQCDSVVTTILSVRPAYNINRTTYICNGDTATLPNGQQVTIAGIYPVTLTTMYGCDSTIRTTVVVRSSYDILVDTSICVGSSYQLPDGQVVTTEGSYTYNGFTTFGCDSIIRTTLRLNPVYSSALNVAICLGSSYQLPNGTIVSTAGIYPCFLQSIYGCDSLITVNLSVGNLITNTVFVNLCQGESYPLPGGGSTTTSGTWSYNTQTPTGCDSTVITNVAVHPNYLFQSDSAICQGDLFILPGGSPANITAIYSDTLHTIFGCDSILVTDLTVYPTYTNSINVTTCQGKSYTLVDGVVVSTPGTYVATLPTAEGCDSIFIYTISFTPPSTFSTSIDLCIGDTYLTLGGQEIDTAGVYIDTLSNNGCDSLIFYFVSMVGFVENEIQGPLVSMQWQTVSYYVPNNSNHFYNWSVIGGDILTGQGTDSITVMWLVGGVGQVILEENNTQCYYQDTLDVSVGTNSITDPFFESGVKVYPNPFQDRLTIEWGAAMNTKSILLLDLSGRALISQPVYSGESLDIDVSDLAPGCYLLVVQGDRTVISRVVRQ